MCNTQVPVFLFNPGFFGKVYRGLLSDENGKNPVTVAIKTVQGMSMALVLPDNYLGPDNNPRLADGGCLDVNLEANRGL